MLREDLLMQPKSRKKEKKKRRVEFRIHVMIVQSRKSLISGNRRAIITRIRQRKIKRNIIKNI